MYALEYLLFFFDELGNVVNDEANYGNAEKGQKKLADLFSETDAECHALVFNEVQMEPISKHRHVLPNGEIGLYPKFEKLVNKD